MIPEDFIQEVLDRVDIADVVGQYVQLKKGGVNLLGLCPFHQEKTPSFTVSPSKQFYHCFGCGAHGSAIGFLMNYTGASFPEAVRMLADRVGMQVPEQKLSPQQQSAARARKTRFELLQDLLARAEGFYCGQLKQYKPAQQYFIGRGLDGRTAKRFSLGWSGEHRQNLSAVFPDYQDDLLVDSGLVIQGDDGRRYDRFRERVMFPIYSARGKIIGFGGRLIADGQPKYLNSPETEVFHKGRELYGLWQNRQAIHRAGQVLVVEGYMDVVSLSCRGIDYAVATLGTATSEEHIKLLSRISSKIIFSFDGDNAGHQAAQKALKVCLPQLRDDLMVRFLFLPDGQDPDSFVVEHGREALEHHIQQAQPLSAYMLSIFAAQHNLTEAEGRAAATAAFFEYWEAMPDIALKRQIAGEFAHQVKATLEELQAELSRRQEALNNRSRFAGNAGATNANRPAAAASSPDAAKTRRAQSSPNFRSGKKSGGPTGRIVPLSRRLLSLLVLHPELLDSVTAAQLETLAQHPDLALVLHLVAFVRSQRSRNFSIWLEQLSPEDELHQILLALHKQSLESEPLPYPDREWQDALRKAEIENLRREQKELIEAGSQGPEFSKRYMLLAERIKQLQSS